VESSGDLMIVPVRTTAAGMVSVRTGRLEDGGRVGIAFTTEGRLIRALGARQPSMRLHVKALRGILRPLGVTRIQVDPTAVVNESALRLGERTERLLLQSPPAPPAPSAPPPRQSQETHRVPAGAGSGGGRR
jgi:hypothetical protein